MKYKLKKDLPFAKAGNKVTLEPLSWREDRKHWIVEVDKDKQTEFYFAQHIGYEDYDMSDWIEEVKPREWWCTLFPTGNLYNFATKEEAEKDRIVYCETHKKNNIEVIKVREVLE